MNLPWAYAYFPSWSPLPPPSPYHPSGSSQCTSPKDPVSNLDCRFISYMILYMFPWGGWNWSPFLSLFYFFLIFEKYFIFFLFSFSLYFILLCWIRKLWYIYTMEYYSAIPFFKCAFPSDIFSFLLKDFNYWKSFLKTLVESL